MLKTRIVISFRPLNPLGQSDYLLVIREYLDGQGQVTYAEILDKIKDPSQLKNIFIEELTPNLMEEHNSFSEILSDNYPDDGWE